MRKYIIGFIALQTVYGCSAPSPGSGDGSVDSSSVLDTGTVDSNTRLDSGNQPDTRVTDSGGNTQPDVPSTDTGMVDPNANEWVNNHNRIRSSVMPVPATPIPAVTWSTSAAGTAQSWASQCNFRHNSGRGSLGENIYAATGTAPAVAALARATVDSWASEVSDYNYQANTCSGVCGHYTQVVWRNTTQIGCGVANCTQNSPFSGFPNWYLVVCNYAPPGNSGGRPY